MVGISKRGKWLHVRVNEQEKAAIEKNARASGMETGAYLRALGLVGFKSGFAAPEATEQSDSLKGLLVADKTPVVTEVESRPQASKESQKRRRGHSGK